MAFGIYPLYRLLQPWLRRSRTRLFMERMRPEADTQILDVGGYIYNWEGVYPIQSPVTFLNLDYPPDSPPETARFKRLVGDGRDMGFADRSFDIVHSNSVIEHVGTYEDQKRFANEVRRVGKALFVQTPNRWFFIEPHFLTAFVHFLPRKLANRLIPFLSLRPLFARSDNVDMRAMARELRLLSLGEMRELFPDCEIVRERFMGMTRSLIAIRRSDTQV